MSKKFLGIRFIIVGVLCSVLIASSGFSHVLTIHAQSPDSGVATITGKVTLTNPDVLADDAEPFMTLIDLTAFVKRDHDMHLPSPIQITTGLQGNLSKGAQFTIPLPIKPEGQLNEVGHAKSDHSGVQIYAIAFDTNAIGDGFLGPFEWKGWPGGNDSLSFDPGTYEVTGGELLVWSPDDKEMFPTAFGPDGKLFTDDDPVDPIPQGWTVVNLGKKPFELIRKPQVDVPILEGLSALNDLSTLSYTQAFDALVKDMRVRYPFTDYKHLDWDQIVKELRPAVEKAEKNNDPEAFNVAMLRFVSEFHDGHVSVDLPNNYYYQQTEAGIGLVLGQTDDGVVIARGVINGLPATKAGIKPGAQILQWNGQPIEQALAQIPLLFETQSSPTGIRLYQLRYIMRSPAGTKFTIQFQNPKDTNPTTVDVVSVKERKSFDQATTTIQADPAEMPVTVKVLPSGFGYVKINTFFGDSVLLTRSWEWTLNKLKEVGVPGLIIDVRDNGGGWGGIARYFAGSFYTQSFVLSKSLEAAKDGKFVYVGRDDVDPAPVQWAGPVAVLIGTECYSACEIFSAAMAHDKNHLMVGRYPTAGVEAGVEPWKLPDGLYFQAPTLQIQYPDGKIFLEGVGVPPNVKVPVTVESLLAKASDQELPAAEKALKNLAH